MKQLSENYCPLCESSDVSIVLTAKDHTVSGEDFHLAQCRQCQFLFTLNPPAVEDIGKYYASDAYISHTDSNEGIFNKVYQTIRKLAISSKRNLVEKYASTQKGSLLDYGCGTGSFLHFMQSNDWRVTGIEADAGARQKASILINTTIHDPSFLRQMNEESMDVITLWHVLEHVHDLHATIDHFVRVLKKDGLMLIAVPNHKSFDASHYGKFWAAYDVPRHLYHFSPSTMEKLMQQHHLRVEKLLPMWFDSFYVSLLSEKYKNGVSRVFPALASGFLSNLKSLFSKGSCSSQIFVIRKNQS